MTVGLTRLTGLGLGLKELSEHAYSISIGLRPMRGLSTSMSPVTAMTMHILVRESGVEGLDRRRDHFARLS